MLFNSFSFLFVFLPVAFCCFFLVAIWSRTAAAAWLAAASLVFYGMGSPLEHVGVLVMSACFNYTVGFLLAKSETSRTKKILLFIGVGGDLSLLGYYKYANFFIDVVSGGSMTATIFLPLGISFFTFTQIAYLVDVYRGHVREYKIVHYLLFVTYFPHLIAGPIFHHAEMIPQFARRVTYSPRLHYIAVGLSIFAMGLVKKTVIADSAAPFCDKLFVMASGGAPITFAEAWVGALAYTIQIYFDFSAYTDMAIGLSKMFGIRLPLNFNSPYKATSIVDFWRRWHMTLSRFLLNYLYIPLGGNRRGLARRYVNLMATMLLAGLWHGAGWTFILWGGMHGLYLVVNHLWRQSGRSLPGWLGGPITFIAVVVAWVFFRAQDFGSATVVVHAMFGGNGVSLPPALGPVLAPIANVLPWIVFEGTFPHLVDRPVELLWVIGIPLLIVWLAPNTNQLFAGWKPALGEIKRQRWQAWRPTFVWAAASAVLLAAGIVMISRDSPFLYFRF